MKRTSTPKKNVNKDVLRLKPINPQTKRIKISARKQILNQQKAVKEALNVDLKLFDDYLRKGLSFSPAELICTIRRAEFSRDYFKENPDPVLQFLFEELVKTTRILHAMLSLNPYSMNDEEYFIRREILTGGDE